MATNNKEVDVTALLTLVAFSPEQVMDAACGNTVLYVDAIRFRLKCLEQASDAKRIWELACAEKDLKLRRIAKEKGDKITEGQIDAKILLDKNINKLAEMHHRAETYDEFSKLIVKVFEMRRDMLMTVSSMVNREYPIAKVAEQAATKMKRERRKL